MERSVSGGRSKRRCTIRIPTWACVMLTTVIYHIWRERNQRLHTLKEISSSQLGKNIVTDSHIISKKTARHSKDQSSYQNSVCNEDIQVEKFLLDRSHSSSKSSNHHIISKICSNNLQKDLEQSKCFIYTGDCNPSPNIIFTYKGSNQALDNNHSLLIYNLGSNMFYIPDAEKQGCHPTKITHEAGHNHHFRMIKDKAKHSGFLPESCSPSLDINYIMGSRQNLTTKNVFFVSKLNSNLRTLPDAEIKGEQAFSSDPEDSSLLLKRKEIKARNFLHKVGNNHYRSKINNEIYHLSCWEEGASSGSKLPEDDCSLDKGRESYWSLISKKTSDSGNVEDKSLEDRVSAERTNPNFSNNKLRGNEDFIWKPP